MALFVSMHQQLNATERESVVQFIIPLAAALWPHVGNTCKELLKHVLLRRSRHLPKPNPNPAETQPCATLLANLLVLMLLLKHRSLLQFPLPTRSAQQAASTVTMAAVHV